MMEPNFDRWAEVLMETHMNTQKEMLAAALKQSYNQGYHFGHTRGELDAETNWWKEQDAQNQKIDRG